MGWLPRKGSKGFISITPIGAERLRMRWFIVVAAGPLASALVAVGCWIAIDAKSGLPNWALDQLLIITLWSVVFAAGGLLPICSGATLSDGAQLRMLIRGGGPNGTG